MNRSCLASTLLYSCASAAINLMSSTVSTWLVYFYAPPLDAGRPHYLSIGLIGILLTIGRCWDACIDPVIGHCSDITRGRWGRRPFLWLGSPLAVLFLILLWIPPAPTSGLVNAGYFFLTSIGFFTSLSLVGIPYDGSLPEVAVTPQARITLSMWKNVFGTGGVLISALVAGPLFEHWGSVGMAVVMASVSLGLFGMTLIGWQEHPTLTHPKSSLWQSLRITYQNRAFQILTLLTVLVQIAYALLLGNLPYFVTLVVGLRESQVSLFQGLVVMAILGSAPVWNALGQRYSHPRLMSIVLLSLTVTLSFSCWVGIRQAIPIALQALCSFLLVGPFLGGYWILIYALMAAVVDHDQRLTQQQRGSTYFGIFSLAAGIGPSLAALLLSGIFQHFGYTATDPLGVRVVFLVAAGLVGLGALAFTAYPCTDPPTVKA